MTYEWDSWKQSVDLVNKMDRCAHPFAFSICTRWSVNSHQLLYVHRGNKMSGTSPLLHTLQASFLSTYTKGFSIASETHFSYNHIGPISSSWIYLLKDMGSNLFQVPLETWIPFSAFYRDESCLLENVNGLLQAQLNDLFLNGIASSHDLFSWTNQQHIHELSIQLLF